MPEPLPCGHTTARAFVAAIVSLDLDRLEDSIAPSIRFRVLTPSSCRRASNAADVRRMFEGWFDGTDLVELVRLEIDDVADRLHFGYRLRVHEPGTWYLVEQQAFGDIDEGRFTSLAIVCSGFRPIDAPVAARRAGHQAGLALSAAGGLGAPAGAASRH